MDPRNFWNDRFNEEELVYGEAPNIWMKTCLDARTPGRILFPAEGQGRNAIYAARLGWDVEAFDFSAVAQQRALAQSAMQQVHIRYAVQSIQEFTVKDHHYDAIGLSYVHLPEMVRIPFYDKLIRSLKAGGELFMEAFTRTQLAYSSGGPRTEDLLYSTESVKRELSALEAIYLLETDLLLQEGEYHKGPAHVIRYIGRKT